MSPTEMGLRLLARRALGGVLAGFVMAVGVWTGLHVVTRIVSSQAAPNQEVAMVRGVVLEPEWLEELELGLEPGEVTKVFDGEQLAQTAAAWSSNEVTPLEPTLKSLVAVTPKRRAAVARREPVEVRQKAAATGLSETSKQASEGFYRRSSFDSSPLLEESPERAKERIAKLRWAISSEDPLETTKSEEPTNHD